MSRRASSRQSIAFSTPQQKTKPPLRGRRSLSLENKLPNVEAIESLFSTLENDPLKKAMVAQVLMFAKRTNAKELLSSLNQGLKQQEKSSAPVLSAMSPAALRRKRALAALEAAESPTSSGSESGSLKKTYPRANVPTDKLLRGVVAYVETNSQNVNKSAGVKALLKTMGARISETIHQGITHAIIKDVSYSTYSKANAVKAHLVSVLWLEAVRKNHCKVPEKDFPALCSEAHNTDLSLICEELQRDYIDLVKDELEFSRNIQREIKQNLSDMLSDNVIDTSQDGDTDSFVTAISYIGSKKNKTAVKCLDMENIPPEDSTGSKSNNNSSGAIEHDVINSMHERLHDFSSDGSFSLNDSSINTSARSSNRTGKKTKKSSFLTHSLKKSIEIGNESQVLNNLSNMQINDKSCLITSDESSSLIEKSQNRMSLRLQISADSNPEDVAVSEPIPVLRVSSGSSRRRTSASSVLSSLRISTELNKLNIPQSASESIPSLRMSGTSLKQIHQSDEGSKLSSLRMSQSMSMIDSSNRTDNSVNDKVDTTADSSMKETISDQSTSNVVFRNVTQRKRNPKVKEVIYSPASSEDEIPEETPKKINKASKRRLYDPNDTVMREKAMQISIENAQRKKKNEKIEIAPVLVTATARKIVQNKVTCDFELNESSDMSPSKKFKLHDADKFKTPGKPVRKKGQTQTSTDRKPPGTPTRRSTRISSILESPRSLNKRRSTLDFLPKEHVRTPTKTPSKARRLTGIVCSRFHRNESLEFNKIVQKLGSFFTEEEVTDRTSHLILGEPKRTVNVLRALARGIWILKPEWIHKSLEEGKWLPEEDYEMTEFSPTVQKSRLLRQAFGKSYSMDVFINTGAIYIVKSSRPPCSDLQDLIKICKGKVTTTRRAASVIVGEYVEGSIPCVSETWIMDTMISNEIQSFDKYLLKPPSRSRRNSEEF